MRRREKQGPHPTITMKAETEQLQQLYKNLQQDWEAFNQSHPSRKYSSTSNATIEARPIPIQLQNHSPRYLMSMLQQQHFSSSDARKMVRNNHEATQERRCDAIERGGKLKGRPLFVAMEKEKDKCVNVSSTSPLSVSFCYSHESSGIKEQCCYSSSSSSCSPPARVVKRVEVTDAETRVEVGNRARYGYGYGVLFGGVAFALLLVAIFMSESGRCNYGVVPLPT